MAAADCVQPLLASCKARRNNSRAEAGAKSCKAGWQLAVHIHDAQVAGPLRVGPNAQAVARSGPQLHAQLDPAAPGFVVAIPLPALRDHHLHLHPPHTSPPLVPGCHTTDVGWSKRQGWRGLITFVSHALYLSAAFHSITSNKSCLYMFTNKLNV